MYGNIFCQRRLEGLANEWRTIAKNTVNMGLFKNVVFYYEYEINSPN